MNVLINAVEAIRDQGTMTIRTEQIEETIVVRISDTGRGIRAGDQPKLFDPRYTRKGVGVGTGLGLSIGYRIIEQHAGSIDLESILDEGTIVTIRLPIATS